MKNQKPELENVPPPSRALVMPVCRVLAGVIRRRRETGENNFQNCKKRLSPFGFGVHVLVNHE